mmetsp:Transcript_19005/g.58564  ORF Transcript_19005/g.58564 Transcript_19005/m.58564 type:complete len:370 (-) Transcript_19005:486-1595(-)
MGEDSKRWLVPLAYEEELAAPAQALVAPGKSILASDESAETLASRFAAFGGESGEEGFAYRRATYAAPDLGKYVSGVLLAEESLFDRASVEALEAAAIIVGARSDGTAARRARRRDVDGRRRHARRTSRELPRGRRPVREVEIAFSHVHQKRRAQRAGREGELLGRGKECASVAGSRARSGAGARDSPRRRPRHRPRRRARRAPLRRSLSRGRRKRRQPRMPPPESQRDAPRRRQHRQGLRRTRRRLLRPHAPTHRPLRRPRLCLRVERPARGGRDAVPGRDQPHRTQGTVVPARRLLALDANVGAPVLVRRRPRRPACDGRAPLRTQEEPAQVPRRRPVLPRRPRPGQRRRQPGAVRPGSRSHHRPNA